MAQPFDGDKMEAAAEPFPIAEGIGANFQNSFFSASTTGVLAYRRGATTAGGNQLTWFDRAGKNLGAAGDPGLYNVVSLSPDGTRAAVMLTDAATSGDNQDIWLHEFARATTTRFTFDPAADGWPVWSPDGSRIAFSSSRGGVFNLFQKPSSNAGTEDLLLKSSESKYVKDWSRDGRFLIYSQGEAGKYHLWVMPLEGDKKPVAYLKSQFFESQGRFSPDTRFVAYNSNASGRMEIYVQPFPDASGGKWMVSKDGGVSPRWRRDGRELFYISPDSKMMAVDVTLSPTFKAGIPKALFPAPISGGGTTGNVTRYDVTADGQRFLIDAVGSEGNAGGASSPITVVLNWQAGLKK